MNYLLETYYERDVRTTARSKGHGQRRTFRCLQRVVEAARDNTQHKPLLDGSAVDALIRILLNGDRIEQQWAWKTSSFSG